MTSQIMSKSDYDQWEQRVITHFYKPNIVLQQKKKVIIVLDFVKSDNMSLSSLVTEKYIGKLPQKDQYPMYQLGSNQKIPQKFGYFPEEGIFYYPTIDIGNPESSYTQIPGSSSQS